MSFSSDDPVQNPSSNPEKTSGIGRRDFIRKQAAAGAALLLGLGSSSPLQAARTGSSGRAVDRPVSGRVTRKPAILGGDPVVQGSWPSWPQWSRERDEPKLLEVMRSGVWSRAHTVDEFEREWAAITGARHAMTTVNGTNALYCALANYDIGAGDEVITSTYTFIATPQSILLNNAIPVFADTDPQTFQLDPDSVEERITERTRAIMPVHIAGNPADMDRIMAIARRHDLIVVEDACQAWLAEWDYEQVGTIGNAGCYSFQNSKNLPIGEGGAIVSNDESFINRCFSWHNYGNPYRSVQDPSGRGTVRRGNKLRMAEYQAAIGLTQLTKFRQETDQRNRTARAMHEWFHEIEGVEPARLDEKVTRLAVHLFPFRFRSESFAGMNKSQFAEALRAEGVPVSTGYAPLNRMPFIREALESKNFRAIYPESVRNYDRWMERNACPNNDHLCNEEALWFTQNLFLASKEELQWIPAAIEKVRENAPAIRQRLAGE